MIGIGTLINTAAVIAGGLIGMLFKKGLPNRFRDILLTATGLSVVFIGVGGALSQMLSVENGKLVSTGTYMMIISLVLGSVLGELINLDKHTVTFGDWLKRKTKSEGDNSFTVGFVNTSLVICVGAMAVVGSVTDGLTGDYSVLLTKGILDFIIVIVFASAYGKGCVFSAIPIFAIQGSITLLAKIISPLLTEQSIANISFVGSVLVFCVGINLMFDKKIKVANMLPSLVIAAACSFLPFKL